eukprot:c25809_g1_i1.p2 GENE.c25809_g1_i1~~c25809_g1_i1.p2  ORF type:complete len:417 (-),score=120.18 c25809_g1_i1:21-1097(-)
MGEWVHTAGEFYGDADKSKGIKTGTDARFYGLSAKFASFSNEGKDLIFQFTVAHQQNIDCGGAYLKLLPAGFDQAAFGGDTPYLIMFGPDICGPGARKTHTILNYKGENHLVKREIPCESDRMTHLYTLHIKPDNTYVVSIDGKEKQSGTIEADWDLLPAKEIKDPAVSKPADWVDEAMMDDPSDTKPADWDAIPEMVADPDATQPEDWDAELDGAWEAPLIDNPAFKGPWKAKRIANPDYKGPWTHPMVPNPEYSADANLYRYKDIGGVGMELWQVKAGTIFDNVIVTDSTAEAEAHAKANFHDLVQAEKAMFDKIEADKREAEEAARKKAEAERAASEETEGHEDHEGHDHEHEDL